MRFRKVSLYFTLFSIISFNALVKGEDIASTLYPYIYTNLNNWPCTRLLNATGSIGCHSLHKKSGVLYQTNTQQDLHDFTTNSLSEDFALVIPYALLTRSNLDLLSSTSKVTGLIVLLRGANETADPSTSPLLYTSPDSACPNCQFGLYANDIDQYQWNPQAQNLIEENFDFPIFAIRPEDTLSQQVYDHVATSVAYNAKNNYQNYPLNAIDFSLFMWGAVNSETCLRRGWCQAVGGMSVYATPSLDISHDDNKPIIIVSANIDSRSMFHDLTIGASKDVSAMITVLAIADALSRAPTPLDTLPKHIMYTLFTAETWGMAGSQRFVNDISTPFTCTNATRYTPCPYTNAPCTYPCVRDLLFTNINFDNIETILEFQSVSGINSNFTDGFYAHVNDLQQNQNLLTTLMQPGSNIQSAASDGVNRKLPPSSAMSFLQKTKNIHAAVITDFQKSLGGFYNSDMDDNIDVTQVGNYMCGLVNSTANTIYNQASSTNSTTNAISANCTLITSLLDCLVFNFSCPFMQSYFNVTGITRVSRYASVYSFENPQPQLLQRFAFSYLSGVTGKQRQGADGLPAQCQTIKDCNAGEYCIKETCVTSFTTYHDAFGTGLKLDESTGLVHVVDPSKGTWTESTWDNPVVRIFLVTSKTHQIVELIVGLLWALMSMGAVVFIKRYLKKALKTE